MYICTSTYTHANLQNVHIYARTQTNKQTNKQTNEYPPTHTHIHINIHASHIILTHIHITHTLNANKQKHNILKKRVFSVVTCPAFTPNVGEKYKEPTCTSGKKFYNHTCEVSCELGYNLTSSGGVHICTENGTWSNDVTCERK